jgi:hypothetical protein
MFQFSLFSSYIPYMMLAMMYVLYLGVYTFDKLQTRDDFFVMADEKENIISWSETENEQLFFDLGNQPVVDFVAPELNEYQNPFSLPERSFNFYFCKNKSAHTTLCYAKFSRPPPRLS